MCLFKSFIKKCNTKIFSISYDTSITYQITVGFVTTIYRPVTRDFFISIEQVIKWFLYLLTSYIGSKMHL